MSTNMVLRGGHVLDLPNGTWHTADVLIEDGTITAVGADLARSGADELDVTGRFVLPGLIDSHVHVTAFSAELRDLEHTTGSGWAAGCRCSWPSGSRAGRLCAAPGCCVRWPRPGLW